MQTGSLVNLMMDNRIDPEPEIGMGATILMWTDRHAATVVHVSADKKLVVIQEDRAVRVDGNGMSDAQAYEYTPDRGAAGRTFTLRSNGAWVEQGSPMRNGTRLSLGHRSAYRDYGF